VPQEYAIAPPCRSLQRSLYVLLGYDSRTRKELSRDQYWARLFEILLYAIATKLA
jgi:hypothetical protein